MVKEVFAITIAVFGLFAGGMATAFSAGVYVHKILTATEQATVKETAERVKGDAQEAAKRAQLEAHTERRFVDMLVHSDYEGWRKQVGERLAASGKEQLTESKDK
ncbi:hypothetical protein HXX76_001696 [Chlamydomonas incerta]|uniref:Uncharacterized protein n=1 Tax=Chlamydomonas incerta TaxID=51695 RepID=A0A835WCZ6_CHLIN|nr:hypothetical protein HXX76_001696 [Chlamydomonas incerta]KAG2444961.1 hypothetical protein HXX76_001696 [Chlamydomonas incerta]|eukprot:KAG2444960.1 hypothetical protein HXX76_001696 [Chlamydomonas incerta]